MKNIIVAVLIAISSQAAFAEWQSVSNRDELHASIDRSRIKKIGDHYRVWVKYSLKEPKEINSITFQSTLSLVEYDCDNERRKRLDLYFYSDDQANGKIVKSVNEPGEWSNIIPGSISDVILNAVCYQNKKAR